MRGLLPDIRLALRGLLKAPLFTCTVTLTLALGIGAATTIFSAVNAVLLRPLTLGEPDRLVMVWEEHAADAEPKGLVAPASVHEWADRVEAFRDVAAYGRTGVTTFVDETGPEALLAVWVTGNFFEVLGLRAAHGRTLRAEETWSDAPSVVVLSERLWTQRFHRDPNVVGSILLVGEVPREVVGILPSGSEFPEAEVDLWLPLGWSRAAPQTRWFREDRFLRVVARLQDGVPLEEAEAELQVAVERGREVRPEGAPAIRTGLTSLRDFLVAEARSPLVILLASTGLLLLLTCANVASLLLVRGSARGPELALRAALGAGRRRIARQLLTENLVLALAGGGAGIAASFLGIRALGTLAAMGAVHLDRIPFDSRVLLFSLALTIVSGLLFGLAPALRGAGAEPGTALSGGGRGVWRRGPRRTNRILVAGEVALAVLLVTGAGLCLRSFVALRQVDPGFRVDDRVAAMVALPQRYDADPRILAFVDDIVPRLGGIPGVEAVTYTSRLPLSGVTVPPTEVTIEGRPPGRSDGSLGIRAIAPNYFDVLGVPVLEGRAFEDGDRADRERVVILNRAAAAQLFPGEDPIGRRLTWDANPDPESIWYRVVGMVGDELQHGLRRPSQAQAYHPFRQIPSAFVNLIIHAPGAGTVTAPAVRAEIASVDPLLPLFEFRTLADLYASTLGRDRFLLRLFGAFATVSLLLAIVGVYGVAAEAATRKRHEIAVRVAVGAREQDLLRLVIRSTVGPAALGVTAGLVLAAGAARGLDAVLFGIAPMDPATFLAVPAVVLAAALFAALPHARRATRVDPMRALRAE